MSSTRDQIVAAVVARLAAAIPALEGRVYPVSAIGWDGRSFPWSVVTALGTRVSQEPGSDGRLERRELDVVVEIHDLETSGNDYAARLGDIEFLVENQMVMLDDDVPVYSVATVSTSGVHEIEADDERGVLAACAVSFELMFYTVKGNAGAFATPDN